VKKLAGGFTTYYIWEGAQVTAEYSNAPAGTGGTSYYLADRLSTRMITDGNGAFKGTQDHLPFGEEPGTTGTTEKHRFTNYERDGESGTNYAMNRQYAIGAGRFMRPDPIQGSSGNPQSLNRYTYVVNEPVSLVDPLGLDKKNEGKCFDEKGQEVPCPNWGDYPSSDDPIKLSVTEWLDNPLLPDWSKSSKSIFIDGWGFILTGTQTVITKLTAIKKKICDTIPSGRTVGVSGALGAVGSVVGGGEIVINYNSGQVSAFGFGGTPSWLERRSIRIVVQRLRLRSQQFKLQLFWRLYRR
jgi:RHS repeat-associated protein